MKRIISLFLTIFLFLSIAGPIAAQNQHEILFGQKHWYTVVFRGNGEAVVSAKLVISNPNETPMTDFSFQIPGAQVNELAIYQVKIPGRCIQYTTTASEGRVCLKMNQPDYLSPYDYVSSEFGNTEYQKITYTVSNNVYHVTLPTPIEKFASSAIILSYAAKGYVDQSMGLSSFTFQTIKIPSRIMEANVTVDVDSDLYLKGKRSSVNYGNRDNVVAISQTGSVGKSAALDSAVSRIGSYGPIMKTGKNLAPNESFVVKGSYSASWLRMHLASILISTVALIVLLIGIPFLSRWFGRRRMASKKVSAEQTRSVSGSAFNPFGFQNILVSFVAITLTAGWSFVFPWLMETVFSGMYYGNDFFMILFAVLVVFAYILLIFGPAVLIGIKKGWKGALSLIAAEFFWLIIALLVVALFLHQASSDTRFVY